MCLFSSKTPRAPSPPTPPPAPIETADSLLEPETLRKADRLKALRGRSALRLKRATLNPPSPSSGANAG